LDFPILPIVNENDAVTVDEGEHRTKFEDNDELSLLIAEAVGADLLIMFHNW
jgi:glutamate 5-kinase